MQNNIHSGLECNQRQQQADGRMHFNHQESADDNRNKQDSDPQER